MDRNEYRTTSYRTLRPPEFHRGFRPPTDSRPFPTRARDFAPDRRLQPRPNFVLQLARDARDASVVDVEALIGQCESPRPESFKVFRSGRVAGSLFFRQWTDAREAAVRLWELRLAGAHGLVPKVDSVVSVPSDFQELEDRLRRVFADHVRGLIEGEEVSNWNDKRDEITAEISKVMVSLRGPKNTYLFSELYERKKRLSFERELVEKRVTEFQSAMNCFLGYLEGKSLEDFGEDGIEVIRLHGKFDWSLIHSLILRERRRLKDGLPMYAYRREILQLIHSQQIMVLIGETGSGKSTQLVQFLADSGIAADEAVVCTQPRKIAAKSLAHRVKDESSGCYGGDSVTCYPMFSSFQKFDSKVIFTTDHCLLQHYMSDKKMSRISCIIVDEVHERSLNTDLLLALVKELLSIRFDLRLIIMSATADANQLSDYFYGCGIFHVTGRNFPVDIRYVPSDTEGTSADSTSYVRDVVKMAREIHRTEDEGAVLAFLTSQNEVEWACDNFDSPAAVALPLHGKLSHEEQFHVFQNYRGKRKIIFATNIAETSLTIPGVKYVIDSGMVKESRYEPASGMNVLRVCRVSQSSANQRAGRAGRTGPGRCYRLYSESDLEVMPISQEPEIRRVHLGVAVLRIFALGVENVQDFDFVDAPSAEAIDMAVRNLVQLGAVEQQKGVYKLTDEGLALVKMGIEPRLGKLILGCLKYRLGREGLVLAAVMANASSIFFRVGTDEEKLKSDCLKVKFCHQNGDLFTLLSVYKEWEDVPVEKRSKWCLENSINAKTMRRCHETFLELESCLERELTVILPTYWLWNPNESTDFDASLKRVILSSLSENVAMYSGDDQLGYEVALTGQQVQLHPSCSLLIYSQRPNWVVFSEILSITCQYLVCVTSFDFDYLSTLDPPLLFNASKMVSRKLKLDVLTGLGVTVLKRFCGKSHNNLLSVVSRIREQCMDDRINIKVNVDQNEITLFATSRDMERVKEMVNNSLEFERRWMRNECMEKCLYQGPGTPSVALFGAGAEIKHLELQKRCLSVDLYCSNLSSMSALEEKELLLFIEKNSSGTICASRKLTPLSKENDEMIEKWGQITFLSPDAAQRAAELNEVEYKGSLLKVIPSQPTFGDHKMSSFPAVKAKVQWPRRLSRGHAVVKCDTYDVAYLVHDFSNLVIGGKYVRCQASTKSMDAVFISGLDKELSESEIFDVLRSSTQIRLSDFFLVRGDAVESPPLGTCEEALFKEIARFMPKKTQACCRVHVFPPEPKDAFFRALITFDGRLHLEAAKALEQIDGKVLPGCQSWQKIKGQQLFQTSLSCPVPVYLVIRKQLESIMRSIKTMQGVECNLDRNANGSYRVKISANATKTIAQVRRRVEVVMRGKSVEHESLTPSVLQLLFSRDGNNLMQSLQRETGTHIFFDRHCRTVRVFGLPDQVDTAKQKLIDGLVALHESKQLEIDLRGKSLPPNLLKEVVRSFGADLRGLKEKVPEAEFTLNTRRHAILMQGDLGLKPRVEAIIREAAPNRSGPAASLDNEVTCPICLCDIEEAYRLEGCGHRFCRFCLLEQCDSAIRNNQDSFPVCCAHEDCGSPVLVADLKSLLSPEKLEELFRASLGAFVASSGGEFRFCPSPDCPSVYRVAGHGSGGGPFVCGSCFVETCTRCHAEYHPYLSCEKYREFKDDPDKSLKEWRSGRENVKNCPVCGHTIEKVDGCNHLECRCGKHICWVCLEVSGSSDECYNHLRNVHMAIV